MSTSYIYDKCPHCNYKEAYWELDCRSRDRYIFCNRCGYTMEYCFAEDKVVKTGGEGSFLTQAKNDLSNVVQSLDPEDVQTLEHLKESQRERLIACKYTFIKNKKWYIKDVLTGETSPFAKKEYSYISKESSQPADNSAKNENASDDDFGGML